MPMVYCKIRTGPQTGTCMWVNVKEGHTCANAGMDNCAAPPPPVVEGDGIGAMAVIAAGAVILMLLSSDS